MSARGRERREQAIVDAYAGGLKLREIAAACGMSVGSVHRVLVRRNVHRRPSGTVRRRVVMLAGDLGIAP